MHGERDSSPYSVTRRHAMSTTSKPTNDFGALVASYKTNAVDERAQGI